MPSLWHTVEAGHGLVPVTRAASKVTCFILTLVKLYDVHSFLEYM